MSDTHIMTSRADLLSQLEDNKCRLDALASTSSEFISNTELPAGISNGDSLPESNPDTDLISLLKVREQLQNQYLALLPKLPISRCPFTGQVVEKTLDTFGVDGPWWDYANPVRPEDPEPATWLGLSGSLVLTAPLPTLTHVVMPGPSVPVIYPGLLAEMDVRAVLSHVRIGTWQGVIVSWYVRRDRYRYTPPNEWGAPWCDVPTQEGGFVRGPSIWQLPDADTDLAPWIRRGKLFWIAPGDDTLLLRADVAACPYLGMPGDGRLQYLSDGELNHVGMEAADMRRENMSAEAFEAAMQAIRAEENGEDA